jgi:uncharacterized protein (DUF4415 family)
MGATNAPAHSISQCQIAARRNATIIKIRSEYRLPETLTGEAPVEDRVCTNAQERTHVKLMIELDRQERDISDARLRRALIPDDWDRLEKTAPVSPRKKKVTVALDEDVARWFRRLGAGYHGRINSVLRTYMLALVSKEVLSVGDRGRHGDGIWGKAAPRRKEE